MIFHWAPHHRLTDWLDCGWMLAPCNAPMHHHEYSFFVVWLCPCKLARPS